ncbi:MAG TPA: thioredoxin-dependent thiol peroxidase [Acidimicrobiia bacterium]|nr:thioredoxin-dependent thiol peroxidase [Acidimicrobiia bacterium]
MTTTTSSSTEPAKLAAGDAAPSFVAVDHTGASRSSEEFAGSKLIIYFYPRAFTPGCTTESCDFRDRHDVFAERGYRVLGVSPDAPDKLAEFRAEYELPFDLLSDPDHAMAAAFGAWGVKKNYGKEYEGIIRSTFVIDSDGIVEDAFYNVKAKDHAERVSVAVTS